MCYHKKNKLGGFSYLGSLEGHLQMSTIAWPDRVLYPRAPQLCFSPLFCTMITFTNFKLALKVTQKKSLRLVDR